MAGRQFLVVRRADLLNPGVQAAKASNLRTALFISREPGRFSTALTLSLVIHALLLSISLGGQTFGLPGLNFPWKERRLEANDLRIQLAPVPVKTLPAELAKPAPVDMPTVANAVTPMTMPPRVVDRAEVAAVSIPQAAPVPVPNTVPAPAPAPEPVQTARKRPDVNLPIAPDAPPVRAYANSDVQSAPAQGNEVPVASDVAQKQIDRDAQERALEQARLESEKLRADRLREAALAADAQREAARQEQLRQDAARAEQAARSEAARQELARQEDLRREAQRQERTKQDEKAQQDAARQELERAEAARQEAVRQDALKREAARQEAAKKQEAASQDAARHEAARQEAARQEATRQEAARQEAARQDAAKQEAARQEAARRETARQDAAKQEAARQEAARQEAARQDAARREAARQEAARQESARQDAAKQEAARQDAAKQESARQERAKQEQAQRELAEQEAKREERLRAIGKQLNEEAAQRDAANNPSRSLLPGMSSLRRGWLLGRTDPNADLVLYAEAMSRKIEQNMTFDQVREVVKQPHTRPIVTVAVRADGSIEKVTFVVSSGVAAIDDSIRKVVASQAPYAAFPPSLARQYDVIEIRRTWIFDIAIRLE